MRILFVTNQYPTDETPGASPCIKQQREAIQQLGHQVDVLFINSTKSKLEYLKATWRIFWAAQVRGQYDIIHAHYGAYCALVARMQSRCAFVVTFRGSDVLWERERPISQFVANKADTVIVMTEEMKDTLGCDDAYVLPYGIDLKIFKPQPQAQARQALKLPEEAPLVLFPYDPERRLKRFDLVQQAETILKEKFPNLQVLVVYHQPHETVATYMNACDAMVLTSDREGAPVAIREAMACNLPIVSVNVGDVCNVIEGMEGCYLVKHDPKEIADKLARVLRVRKRINGWRAVQRMSLSYSAAEVAAIYGDLFPQSLDNQPTSIQDSTL